jgi:chromosomal replication initiator protein
MADILKVTAQHFKLDPGVIRSKGRRQELVIARQVAMYVIREMTTHSYPEIGQFFGGRDHTTVMYAVQKVTEQLAANDQVARSVRQIQDALV